MNLPIDAAEFASEAISQSHEDLLDTAYGKNRKSVKEELLTLVRSKESSVLNLITDLVKKMGYFDAEVTGRAGGGGIDGVVYTNPLRTDSFLSEAKNWAPSNPVRSPDIQKFAGSSRSFPLAIGLSITTS